MVSFILFLMFFLLFLICLSGPYLYQDSSGLSEEAGTSSRRGRLEDQAVATDKARPKQTSWMFKNQRHEARKIRKPELPRKRKKNNFPFSLQPRGQTPGLAPRRQNKTNFSFLRTGQNVKSRQRSSGLAAFSFRITHSRLLGLASPLSVLSPTCRGLS